MVTTKLNLSMTEPSVRQIYAKQGDTGRVLDITLDQTPEDGTLRILRPDGVEVTSEAVTGGEVESGGTFESLTEADVTELTVGIEPVQDLNGYDKPWVGGAGKNKMPTTATTQTVSGVNITIKDDGSFRASGTATADVYLNLGDASASANTWIASCGVISTWNTYGIYIRNVTDNVTINMINVANYTFTVSDTKTIRFVLFIKNGQTVNTDFYPMLRLAAETDPTWQPYSNICPITGHTEVNVTRAGKNLLDTSNAVNATNVVDSVDADGTIHFKDVTARWGSTYIGKMFVKAGQMYVLSATLAYGRIGLSLTGSYPQNGVNIPDVTVHGQGDETTLISKNWASNSFTANYTGNLYVFYCSDSDYSSYHATFSTPIWVNVGSTATTYEPYQGSTYTTSLGQTVYGGTLDMVTGVLTVTHKIINCNGSEQWSMVSSGYFAIPKTILDSELSTTEAYSDTMICNGLPWLYLQPNTTASFNAITHTVRVSMPSITTLSDFRTYLSNNNLQFVLELAEPQTYTLTPQQIKTLVGTNNVWASSGDIVSIKFTYGGLLSELPSDATSVVGKCYCDIEQSGVSSMPFTLNVKKNERES